MANRTPDLFDGVFDNQRTGRREVWQEGRLCRYARRNCCGTGDTSWSVLDAPWGSYPDHPSNAAAAAA